MTSTDQNERFPSAAYSAVAKNGPGLVTPVMKNETKTWFDLGSSSKQLGWKSCTDPVRSEKKANCRVVGPGVRKVGASLVETVAGLIPNTT